MYNGELKRKLSHKNIIVILIKTKLLSTNKIKSCEKLILIKSKHKRLLKTSIEIQMFCLSNSNLKKYQIIIH